MSDITIVYTNVISTTPEQRRGIPRYRFPEDVTREALIANLTLWDSGTFACIWDEAIIENDHRDALVHAQRFEMSSTITVLTVEKDEEDRTAQAQALATMRRREDHATEKANELQRQLNAATRDSITDPKDPRLLALWTTAAETARDEGFCSEYDRLARAMGIPDRNELLTREWDVSVEVTVTRYVMVRVTADDEDAAIRIADGERGRVRDAMDDQWSDAGEFEFESFDAKEAERVED